jgi:hypothetical protein
MPVSSVLSKDASVTMRGRDDVPPGFPEVLCLNPVANRVPARDTVCLHGTSWLERAGERFGVPRSHGCVRP